MLWPCSRHITSRHPFPTLFHCFTHRSVWHHYRVFLHTKQIRISPITLQENSNYYGRLVNHIPHFLYQGWLYGGLTMELNLIDIQVLNSSMLPILLIWGWEDVQVTDICTLHCCIIPGSCIFGINLSWVCTGALTNTSRSCEWNTAGQILSEKQTNVYVSKQKGNSATKLINEYIWLLTKINKRQCEWSNWQLNTQKTKGMHTFQCI